MKDTLLYLLTQLVDHPEELTIDEQAEGERVLLTIHAHAEDMGKIIGKQGRIIRSLRDVIKILAAKQNAYVDVILAE